MAPRVTAGRCIARMAPIPRPWWLEEGRFVTSESHESRVPDGEGADDPRSGSDRYTEALRRFSGDLRMTQQVFQSMRDRDVPIEERHYRLVLKAHLDGRDLQGARTILAEMQAAGIDVDAAVRWDLAIAAGRAGRTDEALALLDELHGEGLEPDPDRAPGVLAIYLSARRFPAARAIIRQMAQRGQAAADADYVRLLRDCLQRRAIKDTRTVIDLMLQVGRTPDPRLATELIAMIARAGHAERAIDLMDRLTAAGVELPGDVHTELLLAHATAGDAAAAEAGLRAMREAGVEPNSFHRNAVLRARIASEDVDGAWKLATELAADGCIPSGENLEGLIDVSLHAGRTAAASGVIDWMLLLGVPVPPQKAAEVIARHLKAGELDTAISLFEVCTANAVPADRRTARDLVERLVRAKRLDEARSLLERLRASGTLTHGRHYGSLLNALANAGRADDAVAVLQDMLANKVTPTSADASRLVGAIIKAGHLDTGGRLVASLQDAGVQIDEPTYRELMWAHARKGQHDPAKAVFDRMVAAGITPDDRHHKALEWASGETPRRLPEPPEPPETPETPEPPEPPETPEARPGHEPGSEA